jgi:hypothetical protein
MQLTEAGKPIESLGFEVGAIIRKIDVDNRVAMVFAGGQERTVKIAGDVKIQDEVGRNLSDGLSSKELNEGATVTLTVERDGNAMVIVSILLGDIPGLVHAIWIIARVGPRAG